MFRMIHKQTGDPWLELLYNLERRMGRAFPGPFGEFEWPGEFTTASAWTPVVDILEDAEALRIVAELPGVKPEDVKIAVEGNLMTIRGTKEQLADEKLEKVHRYERTYGTFERSFTLPATVDANHIKATYELGLLNVVLPKVERAKPREIKIDVPAKALKG
jgi:HSP20 family protein